MSTHTRGLRSYPWKIEYRTSAAAASGKPVDILHDFYIPALKRASRYDRVAGYFRSSSLAAASKGFSSFVGREGKMRLLVGADLDEADVQAILAGDEARMAMRLNEELNPRTPWSDEVFHGVTLLAWMVAHEYLDVKVAFRVDRASGEPRPFDWTDDGYVHEKWLILHDDEGNSLAAAGSLNESRTGLSLNAENLAVFCDWNEGTDRERVRNYVADFESLWNNEHPHLQVLPLPEAVRQELIRLSGRVDVPREIDGTSPMDDVRSVPKEPSVMERLRFGVIRDAAKMPGGRYVGLETAPIEPWPHQRVVVQRLIETWPYSYLLCDEVGLGKTIEAGLAFRSLYLSGVVQRVLIAAPASLTRQWQREMASKMLLPFGIVRASPTPRLEYIFPDDKTVQINSLYDADLAIISTGLLARAHRAKGLRSATPYDVVLVDEAHAARRQNATKGTEAYPQYNQLYSAIGDYVKPAAKSLWLATATPMQLHPVEVTDLLRLMDRTGSFQFDPSLTLAYYELLSKLVRNNHLAEAEWNFLRRAIASIETLDPFLWRYIHSSVVDGRSRVTVEKWVKLGEPPKPYERASLNRLVFAASPLSRVMFRHSRPLLEIYREKGQLTQNLAKRHVLPIRELKFTPLEKRAYDDLEDYARELVAQVARHSEAPGRNMVQFLLSFMRLRFASSLFAIKQTIKRRLAKVEATIAKGAEDARQEEMDGEGFINDYEIEDDDEAVGSVLKGRQMGDLRWERERLTQMLRNLDTSELEIPSKMTELFRVLDGRKDHVTGRIKQTVIFTRFYDTLTDIVRHLRSRDVTMRIGTYSGKRVTYYDVERRQMIEIDRERVKELFLQGEIDVLVCTDAAAEGLNLQTANMLINFDLGWNPMKIEQRIGRIDRIGQRHDDIYVLNLCYADSVEATVYGRLWERLQQAQAVVGTQQPSILPITADDFRQLAEGHITAEALMERAEAEFAKRRRWTESMEIPPNDLYEMYTRLQTQPTPGKAPVDREAIQELFSGSAYLKQLGWVQRTVDGHIVFEVRGIDGVADATKLTVSPELYERGLPQGEQPLHFASYGDPKFDRVLDHMDSFELPPSIRRIHVSLEQLPQVEMVAYAVLCRKADGTREVRFVKSWADVKELDKDNRFIDEGGLLSDGDVAPLKQELLRTARQELVPHIVADEIEQQNIISARAQQLLNVYVISELLEHRGRAVGQGASFLTVMRDIDRLYEGAPSVLVNALPADIFRSVQNRLLFDVVVPTVEKHARLRAPRILLESAIDLARVIEDRYKRGRGALPYEAVLRRLQQEAGTLSIEIERLRRRVPA